ncbi:unnamed protein product [Bursaphelenchus xylophilus]|nr:unnamed protein product [Bursaphelenchus xylophilus]CAG9118493.1 unnamed protein product [Bursaphelenchus xylophilus]
MAVKIAVKAPLIEDFWNSFTKRTEYEQTVEEKQYQDSLLVNEINVTDACYDGNICCKLWASQGECKVHDKLCPLSCGGCNATHPLEDCVDYDENCPHYVFNGLCDSNPWFLENCRKSCGTCVSNVQELTRICRRTHGLTRV